MKKLYIILTLCAVLLTVLTLPCPSVRCEETPQLQTPKIVFEETEHDFGEIPQGSNVTYTFTFNNDGEGTLEIGKLKTSCGCTAALASRDKLEPGDKGEVKVTFTSGKFKGNITKTVTVPSNDPKNPEVALHIKAVVKVDIEITPNSLNFGDMPRGSSATKVLTLTKLDGTKIKIVKIESKSENITASIENETEEKSSYNVNVTLSTGQLPRVFAEKLKIYTDSTIQPVLEVFIRARVTGDVVVTPQSIFLGSIIQGETKSSAIIISNGTSAPLKINSIEAKPEYISTSQETLKDGEEYRVTVTLSKEAPIGTVKGNLIIHTNSPSEPDVTVPVTAIVRQKS